jgi:hypothetical protein
MKNQILNALDNPDQLELLYRSDQKAFSTALDEVYVNHSDHLVVRVWHHRLHYASPHIKEYTDVFWLIIGILIAGLLAKIPAFFNMKEDDFYARNVGFIVFPLMSIYFLHQHRSNIKRIAITISMYVLCAVYINFLHRGQHSDVLTLSTMHLVFVSLAIMCYNYIDGEVWRQDRIWAWLKYMSHVLILAGLLLIAGVIITGISFALFALIEIDIESFAQNYLLPWGLPSIPLTAAYIVDKNSLLLDRLPSTLARVFSPVVLVIATAYLGGMLMTLERPFEDREFLLLFNVLLVGVMVLIVFSILESVDKSTFQKLILIALASVSIIINGIALSAIIFRINEWGLSPNRLAVLGANILMFLHLVYMCYSLIKNIRSTLVSLENIVTRYSVAYIIWCCFVVFIFPIIFMNRL